MYSNRLAWNQPRNRIASLVEARKLERRPLLDLTISNPLQAGFAWAPDLLAPLGDARALQYNPDPRGLLSAREAVAEYQGTTADRVLLTASTSEAYAFLFKLLADPGDEVLAPRPSYPLFDYLARLESVRIVQYPLFYDHGWSIDLGSLESLITTRTRAIVLVSPNNPTGSFVKAAELAALEAICVRHDLALISDEVFSDYALAEQRNPDWVRCAARSVQQVTTFSLSGLSKVCGLPQLKLAWIVSNSPPALERLELLADTYLSVSTPVQLAAAPLLEARHEIQKQILSRLRSNLARLDGPLIVEGGWTAVIRVPGFKSDEEWVLDLVEQHGVLVQPGFFYDFSSGATHIVVSLLTPEADFAEGSHRLQSVIDSLLQV